MGDDHSGRRAYPADEARQGEIILRKRWQRIIFIAGIVGAILLALIWQLSVYS